MDRKDQRLFDNLTKLTDEIDDVLFELSDEWDGNDPDIKKVKKLEKKLDRLYKKRANLISKFSEKPTVVGRTTYGAEIFEPALSSSQPTPLPGLEPFELEDVFGEDKAETSKLPQPYQFQRSIDYGESGIGNILPDTFVQAYEENESVLNNLNSGLASVEKGLGNALKNFLKGQKTNNEKLTVIQNKTKTELQEKSKLNKNAIVDFFKTWQERFSQSKEEEKKEKKKKSSRFGKFVEDAATPLLEGIIGFLIDLAAFKALQWLADPANRDTIKEAFDALFNFFEVAKNITIGGIKLSIEVFEFFEKFTNPFDFEKRQGKEGEPRFIEVNGKKTRVVEMGFKLGDSEKKLEDNNKKLSAVDKALSSLSKLGMQPAVASDELPDQEKLNMLKEFGDVPGVDLKNLGLLDEMPDVKEFDKVNKGIADAQNTLGKIDKGKKQNSGASPSSSGSVPSLDSVDYSLDSDQERALNTALKGDSDKNFKPLDNKSKPVNVDGKKMKDVFELPIKAVGSSIIAMSLGSIAGIPGMVNVVRPIMGNIASKFGLSTSVFSRFLTAGSGGTDDFAETMKLFIKVLKNISSFGFGNGDDNKNLQQIMNSGNAPLSGNEKVQSIIKAANQAGMTPEEMAAIIALESGFDPTIDNIHLGPDVYKENGPHFGLWQAGKAERKWAKDYLGIPQETDWREVPFDKQMEALIPWAMSRGFKPGMENAQLNLYSTILTGSPGNFNSPDGKTTTVSNSGIQPGGTRYKQAIEWLKKNGYEGMMRGGLVQGDLRPGDSVPALLEPGEYVLNKNSVDAFEQIFGKGSLDELNFTKAKRFGEKINLMGTDLKNIGSKLDMEMLKRYQRNKKVKMNDGKVNTIVLPEKINTKVNTMSETFSKGLLGDTVDVDSVPFTSMMFDYV